MSSIKQHVLIRHTKKTGKINKVIDGLGTGMLRLWALQNTRKHERTIIFEYDTGKIIHEFIGQETSMCKTSQPEHAYVCNDLLHAIHQDIKPR